MINVLKIRMGFEFNLGKISFIFIITFVLLFGIVIAQTPVNPGHSSDSLWVPAISGHFSGDSLNNVLVYLNTRINGHNARITSAEISIGLLYAGINCPLGMFEVGASPGIKGSYCVSSLPRGTGSWVQAATSCASSGYYLCSTAELVGACNYVGYTPSTQFGWGTPHWADDFDTSSNAIIVAGGSCNSINSVNSGLTNYQHRCCKNLIGNN